MSAPPEQNPGGRDIQVPNEYFHTVPLTMYWLANGADASLEEIKKAPEYAKATGFFYRVDGQQFIVTARHNFSARNWETNEFLSTHSVAPTHVKVTLRVAPEEEGGSFQVSDGLAVEEFVFPLVDCEEVPLWIEHSERDRDLAALAFQAPSEHLHILPLEPFILTPEDARFWVTQDVFIAGYPFGVDTGYLWPLWTRGTIASEPTMYFIYKDAAHPFFLVDARARTGQSGSPVFLLRRPFWQPAPEDALPRTRLLGVYTGRLNTDGKDNSDLGIVWHIGEVDRICRDGVRGIK